MSKKTKKQRAHKIKWIVASVALVILIGCASIGPIMSRVAEPEFKVIAEKNNIQIREYVPTIVAEAVVTGERGVAINDGFRLIADYIFGNNTAKGKIAMTAPVMQQTSEKIAMTVPVKQQALNDNTWTVQFVMPAAYTLEALPKPNNSAVKIKAVAAKKYAVMRFSGMSTTANMKKYEALLQAYVADEKLKPLAAPIYAFYNPPWTLPFLRRNEVMVEIK